jgi:hypothetical protein
MSSCDTYREQGLAAFLPVSDRNREHAAWWEPLPRLDAHYHGG